MPRRRVTLLLLLAACVSSLHGCGITTHAYVAERAVEFLDTSGQELDFAAILRTHLDDVYTGSRYPDVFYNPLCDGGAYDHVAEDTHWVPFLNESVHYIRETYPHPWDLSTQKLVAFLFGIASHQMADVSWHSLDLSNGFIKAMSELNFHGSFSSAHDTADFGGDVWNVLQLGPNLKRAAKTWYIPTKDLAAIYERYYKSYVVSPLKIATCAAWMYLGAIGENLGIIEMGYPYLAAQSPFLADELQRYFLGGMDDMAAWTAQGWRNLAYMLHNGTAECDMSINPMFVHCGSLGRPTIDLAHRPHKPASAARQYIIKLFEQMEKFFPGLGMEMSAANTVIKPTADGRGVTIAPSVQIRNILRVYEEEDRATIDLAQPTAAADPKADEYRDYAVYSTSTPYAQLSTVVSGDINNDGYADLVVGAPAYSRPNLNAQGRVFVLWGNANGIPENDTRLEENADYILDGYEGNSRFGSAVAVVDLNADGRNDLVVSAPSSGAFDIYYHGKVFIYFGSTNTSPSSKPDVEIICDFFQCNLGVSLASADVNSDGFADLLVGAPYSYYNHRHQAGFAGLLLASTNIVSGTKLSQFHFNQLFPGDQSYAWFGYSISANNGYVAFGSPSYRVCARDGCAESEEDAQLTGRVYVYATSNLMQPLVTLTGGESWGEFGHSVYVGQVGSLEDSLVVGSPVKSTTSILPHPQSGMVQIYQISPGDVELKRTLKGPLLYTRFGASLTVADVYGDGLNDVIVGAPMAADGKMWSANKFYSGQVNIYEGSRSGVKTKPCCVKYVPELKTMFGTQTSSITSANKVQLAISAPLTNEEGVLTGRIYVMPIEK